MIELDIVTSERIYTETGGITDDITVLTLCFSPLSFPSTPAQCCSITTNDTQQRRHGRHGASSCTQPQPDRLFPTRFGQHVRRRRVRMWRRGGSEVGEKCFHITHRHIHSHCHTCTQHYHTHTNTLFTTLWMCVCIVIYLFRVTCLSRRSHLTPFPPHSTQWFLIVTTADRKSKRWLIIS